MPPRLVYLPIIVMIAIMGYGGFRAMRRNGNAPADWFPPLALALFLAALTYYSFVTLSVGSGTSPAWYLHSMAPIMAALVGCGVADAARTAWLKNLLTALWLYPLLLLAAMTGLNLLYFAGCAAKLPERSYFARANALECLADYPRMIENLGVIASPRWGIALFVIGWLIAFVAMAAAIRHVRAASDRTA